MLSLFESFKSLDIRVGTVTSVDFFKNAIKPSYKLTIDFGNNGVLKSSAQITRLYDTETLIGTQVIAIVNFPKKQIANFMSQCLVLGIVENDEVVLLRPDKRVKNGLKFPNLHNTRKENCIQKYFISSIPKCSKVCVVC